MDKYNTKRPGKTVHLESRWDSGAAGHRRLFSCMSWTHTHTHTHTHTLTHTHTSGELLWDFFLSTGENVKPLV